jgi:hypothetical protein
VIVADHLVDPQPFDVRNVAVGAPRARNVGIVAVDVTPLTVSSIQVFAAVWNDSEAAETVVVTLDAPPAGLNSLQPGARVRPQEIVVPAFTARSVRFDTVPLATLPLSIDARDDLAADDRVELRRALLAVGFAKGPDAVPAAHRAAVDQGFRAVLGVVPDASEPDVWVGPPEAAPASAQIVLVLRPLPAGAQGFRPPPGSAFDPGPPDLAKDIDPAGCDLVYAPDVAARAPFPIVRAREVAGRRIVEFVPDPLAGTPPPVDHPLWPIFLENLVGARFGQTRSAGHRGYRVVASVDPLGLDSTRLGRDVRPFDPAWLDGARPVGEPRVRDLSPWLAAAGLALLALLWFGRRAVSGIAAARVP